ncbi:hypothetical protein SUGI_0745820 [Cryptomeria japonica]|nr:hypothetical protein SUGI_0745820 [Cryptomeria japonica]
MCMMELLIVKRIDSFRFLREEEVFAMIISIWHESGCGAQCVDFKKSLSSVTRNITCRMFANRTYFNNELSGRNGFKQMVEEIFNVAGAFCVGDFIPFLGWLDL